MQVCAIHQAVTKRKLVGLGKMDLGKMDLGKMAMPKLKLKALNIPSNVNMVWVPPRVVWESEAPELAGFVRETVKWAPGCVPSSQPSSPTASYPRRAGAVFRTEGEHGGALSYTLWTVWDIFVSVLNNVPVVGFLVPLGYWAAGNSVKAEETLLRALRSTAVCAVGAVVGVLMTACFPAASALVFYGAAASAGIASGSLFDGGVSWWKGTPYGLIDNIATVFSAKSSWWETILALGAMLATVVGDAAVAIGGAKMAKAFLNEVKLNADKNTAKAVLQSEKKNITEYIKKTVPEKEPTAENLTDAMKRVKAATTRGYARDQMKGLLGESYWKVFDKVGNVKTDDAALAALKSNSKQIRESLLLTWEKAFREGQVKSAVSVASSGAFPCSTHATGVSGGLRVVPVDEKQLTYFKSSQPHNVPSQVVNLTNCAEHHAGTALANSGQPLHTMTTFRLSPSGGMAPLPRCDTVCAHFDMSRVLTDTGVHSLWREIGCGATAVAGGAVSRCAADG
eukprot:GHVN01023988.1.p1 GENE.GHVN01023988.1~~GHVN01023988.1.p1  ORF type:complete len:509 (-),score=39.91 GHVN01023988.1:907-2433(-)